MILETGMKLYHGSYTSVEIPDLSACKPSKDFGLGFYLTTDLNQAKRFIKTDNTAIGLLLPDKLTDQICFKTDKSLRKIKYVNAIECHF
ncbi:MAG: DUF3990 domain-containing protein [Lachnospiraceae bacterium]|nr:DUF3990 domain-containing protein [Lachnospiraceae bacterium]